MNGQHKGKLIATNPLMRPDSHSRLVNNEKGFARSSQEKRNDPRKARGIERKRERSKYHFEEETREPASAAETKHDNGIPDRGQVKGNERDSRATERRRMSRQ